MTCVPTQPLEADRRGKPHAGRGYGAGTAARKSHSGVDILLIPARFTGLFLENAFELVSASGSAAPKGRLFAHCRREAGCRAAPVTGWAGGWSRWVGSH